MRPLLYCIFLSEREEQDSMPSFCQGGMTKITRISSGSNDTVACRTYEHDGVGELRAPRGVSQARVARRTCGCAQLKAMMTSHMSREHICSQGDIPISGVEIIPRPFIHATH